MEIWRARGVVWALALTAGLMGCGDGDGNASPGQEAMQAWMGKDFSRIEVQDLDGAVQPLSRAVEFEKKPVIVNVWATWCPPCLVEMPTLDALGKEGKYTVIAIATDKDAQTVKDFLKKQSWGQGVQVWFDRLGATTRREMGAIGLPVTYVLDEKLQVKLVEAGERDWTHPKMQAKVAQALRR